MTPESTPVPELTIESDESAITAYAYFITGEVQGCIETEDASNDETTVWLNVDEMKQLRNWLNLCIESAEKHHRETH